MVCGAGGARQCMADEARKVVATLYNEAERYPGNKITSHDYAKLNRDS